jgi:hypothetical protein
MPQDIEHFNFEYQSFFSGCSTERLINALVLLDCSYSTNTKHQTSHLPFPINCDKLTPTCYTGCHYINRILLEFSNKIWTPGNLLNLLSKHKKPRHVLYPFFIHQSGRYDFVTLKILCFNMNTCYTVADCVSQPR